MITAAEWGDRWQRLYDELRAEGRDDDSATEIADAVCVERFGEQPVAVEPDLGGQWAAVFIGDLSKGRTVTAPAGEHFPPDRLDGYRLSSANEATRVATYRAEKP